MGQYRVLIVDDDEAIRKMIGRYLENAGYYADYAGTTAGAISRLEESYFDAVISDVNMPGPGGMELLAWIKVNRAETAAVILSGCGDINVAVHAMKNGALDFIVKPFRLEQVAETLGKAIGKKKAHLARALYLADLEATLEHQADQLRSTMSQLEEASQDTLDALVTALDARERETHAHSKRVSEYSVLLAQELGVGGTELEVIRQGSMLHDIGKIGIPDRILLKPDGLTPEEWAEMRKHPAIGAWIVGGVESLRPAAGIVIAHHERYDGAGYPNGVAGEQIPLGARVFAVADTLDAVISDRPYRSGQPISHAREEIERNSGSQFDPRIAECFLKMPIDVWDENRSRAARSQQSHLVMS